MGKGSEKVRNPKTDAAIWQYREVRGTLIRKYRSIGGRYIFVLEEKGTKTKIRVGKALDRTPHHQANLQCRHLSMAEQSITISIGAAAINRGNKVSCYPAPVIDGRTS